MRILEAIVVIILIEIFLHFLIHWLKKDFQWLITNEDEFIEINGKHLNNFIAHGYDSVLGWERKANTEKIEKIKGVGEYKKSFNESRYLINNNRARCNPGHESCVSKIITFGDSFAFCRHVNDNQTWQWHLSELTKSNVVNFGVGNYCVGQSLIRMRKEIHAYHESSRIVIMMTVPETISRIVNVWKHYSEYGNTFGFKGRFYLDGNNIKWFDNVISEPARFNDIEKYLPEIKDKDYCYLNKFKKDQLRFPYIASLLRSNKRNPVLIFYLILRKMALTFGIEKEYIINKAWETVLKSNNDFAVSLYAKKNIINLFIAIIIEFKKEVESNGMAPMFVMVPYLHDVRNFQKNKPSYYKNLIDLLDSHLIVIDVLDTFSSHKRVEDLYVNKFYGAHLSEYGNKIVAQKIYTVLDQSSLLFGNDKSEYCS